MIIKSHIRGGYRSAAEYLKEQGQNEKTRLVEISDKSAKNIDEAFQKMWVIANNTKCKKPLHHISINPMKDEHLTDKQVLAIVMRCEEVYGYNTSQHQRVIVEHIKDGRQHFHVIWNRVNTVTNKAVWPGEHWKKSKQICREMEVELGLKRPTPKYIRNSGYKSPHFKQHKKIQQRYKISRLISFKQSKAARTVLRFNVGIRPLQFLSRYNALSPSNISIKFKPIYNAASAATPQRPLVRAIGQKRSTGWPEAAIADWKNWGFMNPRRFFAMWPQLGR
jgi:hypothetical protein